MVGIYNSQSYLNEVASYPKTTKESLAQANLKTSVNAIQEVLDDTALSFIPRCKSMDTSLWVNCTNTRSQFVDKIINHAWLDVDDAPILYSDLNGNAYYTSVKTLCKQKYKLRFQNTKYYFSQNEHDGLIALYNDCNFLHASGPILNQGGYKVSETYYNPYNMKALLDKDIKVADVNFKEIVLPLLKKSGNLSLTDIEKAVEMDNKTMGKKRLSEYQQNDPYIATRSNKASSQLNRTTRKIDAGVYFRDFHNHYDLAPIHNEMIRRSFFQNFVSITVDVHRLPQVFVNGATRPVLGDKVFIDFTNEGSIDKIHSGNYIICGIKHCFQQGNTYTMDIIAVSDGTYGKGSLEKDE